MTPGRHRTLNSCVIVVPVSYGVRVGPCRSTPRNTMFLRCMLCTGCSLNEKKLSNLGGHSPLLFYPVMGKDVKMKGIEIDDSTLTHLLGYLTARQWAIALKSCPYTALIFALIREQDKKCLGKSHKLEREVNELLEELKTSTYDEY